MVDSIFIHFLFYDSIPDQEVARSIYTLTSSNYNVDQIYKSNVRRLTSSKVDSVQLTIFSTSNDTVSPHRLTLFDVQWEYGNENSASAFEPVEVYPNPSKSGYFYTNIAPHQFDEVFVKDLSKEARVFEATKNELMQKTLRIDLTQQPSGRYLIVFKNDRTIIRKRVLIH